MIKKILLLVVQYFLESYVQCFHLYSFAFSVPFWPYGYKTSCQSFYDMCTLQILSCSRIFEKHTHSTYLFTQNSDLLFLLTVLFTQLNLFVLDCFLQVIRWLCPHPVPSARSKKLDNKLVVHSVKAIYIESEKVLISNSSPCCSPIIIPSPPLARNLSPF